MNFCELMPDHDVLMCVADWVIRLRKAATCRRELMMRWESNRQMREITCRRGLLHEGRALLLSPGDIDRQLWHSAEGRALLLSRRRRRDEFYRPQRWRSGSNFSNLTDNLSAPLIMSDTLNTKYFIGGIRIYPQPSCPVRGRFCMLYSSVNQITELCLKKGWKPPFEGTTREEFISSVRFLMNNEDIIEY